MFDGSPYIEIYTIVLSHIPTRREVQISLSQGLGTNTQRHAERETREMDLFSNPFAAFFFSAVDLWICVAE